MRITWLGWAGVEIDVAGRTVVIDPLADPTAVFAPFGARATAAVLPPVVPPRPGTAVAGLLTHLHRDHADAAALASALAAGAPVLEPHRAGGAAVEDLALAQADGEITASGLVRRALAPWETTTASGFRLTALPAVDGLGDPQVSWLVEADGRRVLHLGDTMYHGHWWRIAQRHGPFDLALLPVNAPVVRFPHRVPPSPIPVAMTPEQAAIAASVLGARLAVPIHAEGYELAGAYEPTPGAAAGFAAAASALGVRAELPRLGVPFEVPRAATD